MRGTKRYKSRMLVARKVKHILSQEKTPIRVLELRSTRMIKLLAKFFRGLHLIFGVSAPPEGQNERTFVLIWVGVLAFLVAFGVALTYFLPYLYFKH